jgi:hypothetical protein
MTAMTTSIDRSTFLRRVILVDAATCVATGLLLALGAGALTPLLELPGALLRYSGLSLFPIAAFMVWVATRESLPRPGVWLIIAGNILWVAGSVLVLAVISPRTLGYAFVIAQAAAVALLAELEIVGLRRL